MTAKQLYEAMTKNEYIIVRGIFNETMGVNCKVALRVLKIKGHPVDDGEVSTQSFCPCSFNEYINKKIKNSFVI